MDPILDYLQNRSRIASAIQSVESGEEVDWNTMGLLQALDLARIGELYLVELIKGDAAADGPSEPTFID